MEKGSIEAVFLEISDDENSIEVVTSPRLLQKGGLQGSSSIQSQDTTRSCRTLSGDSPLPSQWTELERRKKFKEAAETVIDSEFAELDAWLDEI